MLQNELNAAFDHGERLLAASLPFEWKPKELSHDQQHRFGVFVEFAKQKCVRACPAKPASVAAFVIDRHSDGVPAQQILALLEAISAAHNYHGSLADPCAAQIVRQALSETIHIEPPRSWSRADRELFIALPPDVRSVLARREQERDAALRRAQNALAEEKKRLLADSADKSVSNIEKETSTNETLQRRQCEARPGDLRQ
jgi:hypothetical protein